MTTTTAPKLSCSDCLERLTLSLSGSPAWHVCSDAIGGGFITTHDRDNIIDLYLEETGYADAEEWAREDHYYSEMSCEWYAFGSGPFADPVDIYEAIWEAIYGESED